MYGIELTDDYLETISEETLHYNLSTMTVGPLHELMTYRQKGRAEKKQSTSKRDKDFIREYLKVELPKYLDYALHNRYRKD